MHFGLGIWIRNNLGLWQGNWPLIDTCASRSADDASTFLIEAFWQHVRDQEPRLHQLSKRTRQRPRISVTNFHLAFVRKSSQRRTQDTLAKRRLSP